MTGIGSIQRTRRVATRSAPPAVDAGMADPAHTVPVGPIDDAAQQPPPPPHPVWPERLSPPLEAAARRH
ncbi:MAG: hypothetical protein KGK18_12090, partial [Burkholderiales bacterium]|nr:hypothetical protein [Burkholderiales bacterium]